jgi:type I restriction-modification system DNA methylase subunit
MSRNREEEFRLRLSYELKEYLDKYRVNGVKLDVRQSTYYCNGIPRIPDIVVVDEKGIPQLIIETKRKSDGREEDLYNPLSMAPIAQALCYAALAMESHGMDRTPLFATANRDVMIIFKGIEREKLEGFVDTSLCCEKHSSPEDWARALRPGAYSRLLQEMIIERLEKPLSDTTIKKLFEYVGRWIVRTTITPAQLYRILIEHLKQHIDKLHDEHVEGAVKARILNDQGYFEELYKQALKQGYRKGILSSPLFSLCPHEGRSTIKKICEPLSEAISYMISEASNVQEKFALLREIASKKVKELVKYCSEEGKHPPPICNKRVGEVLSFRNLSRMMAYVLAAKILAYKVLEIHYSIPSLKPLGDAIEVYGERIEIRSPNDITRALDKIFTIASKKLEESVQLRDFKPLFETGLYDMIVFEGSEAIQKVNALIEIADAIKESLKHLPGIIGYVYEGFIPPIERHQFGQFYTPPAVARLIARWSIRSSDDKVLDGGCGSGTFLIEAYKRLLYLRYNKVYGESYPSCREGYNEHQEVLNNLYGVDINAFASQLTALHLMFMEPRCPFSQINIKSRDFFSLGRENLEGIEFFDAVIGNPPYTRWVEIPDETRKSIENRVGGLAQKYDLIADVRRGREPGIYIYWILHASKNLLKDGGRLGMIISNMWLQTDYGVDFGRFMLENFKIKALIDISYRLFDALISTVIVLAEKEPVRESRDNNRVLLVRIPPIDSRLSDKDIEGRIGEVLREIENSITPEYEFSESIMERCRERHGIWYGFVRQSEIPRDKKWISLFFQGVEDILNVIESHPLMIRAGDWFKPSRGNSVWSIWALDNGRRPDLGAKDFFYFNTGKIESWEEKLKGFRDAVKPCLVPAITASRYVKTFTFTEEDWRAVEDAGQDSYILMVREGREKLPYHLLEYIKWGETECRTRISKTRGGGRICSEAEACRAREEVGRPLFHGWYDLGGYIPTPMMAVYQPRYHPQFFLATAPFVTYHALITFIPRVRVRINGRTYSPVEYSGASHCNIINNVNLAIELDEAEVKAILAYLNSTFNWLWLEQNARYIAKGPLGLEVSIAERMPVLDVKRIDRIRVVELAEMFDELESRARRFVTEYPSQNIHGEGRGEEDGKLKFRMFKELKPIFARIDGKIAETLGINMDADTLWGFAFDMMKRRVMGARRRVRPGASIEVNMERSRRKRRSSTPGTIIPLTHWLEPEDEEEPR